MKIQKFAPVAALCVAVSGCATIIDGTTQSVSVSTTPVQGAACTLTSSEGTWYVTTPGTVTVHKTKNDLNISCAKAGFANGNQVAVSKFGGATFGNIVAGGIIGAGVDAASGANYYYDTPITVPLGEPTGSGSSAPASAPAEFGKPAV